MSKTRNVTFVIPRDLLARLDAEAFRRTVEGGAVVSRSEVLRDAIAKVCTSQAEQAA